jgi:hypothetical protein
VGSGERVREKWARREAFDFGPCPPSFAEERYEGAPIEFRAAKISRFFPKYHPFRLRNGAYLWGAAGA